MKPKKKFRVIRGGGKGAAVDKYRKQEIAKIHTLKALLGLDEETYRAMLELQVGMCSAKELGREQRLKVIAHLKKALGQAVEHEGKPHNLTNKAQLQKIEALLTTQKKPWSYGHAIAKQMFGKEDLTFCTGRELRAVITALVKAGEK